jgi:hypothetical protein
VFVNVGGVWHGGAGHWLRPGQFCKGEYDENFFRDGFNGRQPWVDVELHPGDVFGMLVSTPARFYPSDRTLDVRTNLVMMVW